MTDDDGKRPQVGVVVTLRDMGGGKTRVILDDVKSDSPCREASWRQVAPVLRTDLLA
jgi:hypothetical protein